MQLAVVVTMASRGEPATNYDDAQPTVAEDFVYSFATPSGLSIANYQAYSRHRYQFDPTPTAGYRPRANRSSKYKMPLRH
jgi:hypothetical protein